MKTSGRLVVVRCILYALAQLLTPVAAVTAEFAQRDTGWPSSLILGSALLTGAIAALLGVLSFLDGSLARYREGQVQNAAGK
jgi:hypothetical protein